MATQTENLGLTKPDAAEGYNIDVFNGNADTIDQFAGEMRNALGGSGGGLGDKVDALQADMTAARSEIAAVKTDTAALVQALATANANIATLLTQTKGVKAIYKRSVNGTITLTANEPAVLNIPESMNVDKIIVLTNVNATPGINTSIGVNWTRAGHVLSIYSLSNTIVDVQVIEFY